MTIRGKIGKSGKIGATVDVAVVQKMVDGIFAFVEGKFPFFATPLEWVQQQIDTALPSFVAYLQAAGLDQITQVNLNLWINQFFAWAEGYFSSDIAVLWVLKTANALALSEGIPTLVNFLAAFGVIVN